MGKSYKDLVEWSLEELKQHLEIKFRDGMKWDNYGGYWHLDHIKPLSSFNPENIMDAWKLDNLQPLTTKENLSKHAKY